MSVLPPAWDGMALSPVVKAGGAPLPETWRDALSELRVRRGIRTIGRCSLRFVDPGYALAKKTTMAVGTPLAVTTRSAVGGEPVVIFEGAVSSVGIEQREGGQPELVVHAQDAAARLGQSSRAATFLKMTTADIASKVVGAAGLSCSVPAGGRQHEYVLQAGTDLAFLDEMLARAGLDWEMDGRSLVAWHAVKGTEGPAGVTVALASGTTLRDFSVSVHGDAPASVTLRGWDHLSKQAFSATEAVDRSTVPSGLAPLVPSGGVTTGKVVGARVSLVDASDAQALAAAAAHAVGTVLARGRCAVTPTLRPGVTATIDDVGPAAGKYYVREVEHVYRSSGFHTTFVAGDRPGASVVDVAGGGAGLAGAGGAGASTMLHDGLVVGLVSQNTDDPQGVGRVKVSLPGLDPAVESQWARLAVIGGGGERGMVFVPEVGDEVLVGFEAGDVRRPVVLGGLFGKKDKIPKTDVADGKVSSRRITSRLGHVVELSDGTGTDKQHILLELAGSTVRLRLGKDKAEITLPDGVPLKIASGSSFLEMDGKGKVVISGTEVTIKGTSKVSLEAAEVVAKAQAKFAASGATVEMKGSASATLEASGATIVKGGMVQIN